jgi:hypothetical protein
VAVVEAQRLERLDAEQVALEVVIGVGQSRHSENPMIPRRASALRLMVVRLALKLEWFRVLTGCGKSHDSGVETSQSRARTFDALLPPILHIGLRSHPGSQRADPDDPQAHSLGPLRAGSGSAGPLMMPRPTASPCAAS